MTAPPPFATTPPRGLPDLIEHDACALAAFATRDGQPSRTMVELALTSLQMMVHRSGSVDGEGDGSGLQVDLPRDAWRRRLEENGLDPAAVFALIALAAIVAVFVAACGDDDDSADTTATVPEGPAINLRGQDFSESVTLAEVYGQYLKAKGYDVNILTPAGFRTEALDGIKNGDLDLIIDYIGGDQAALAPDDAPSKDPEKVVATITPLLADMGATLLPYSPATDEDAFVVRGDSTATTISDVKGLDYRFGAASACFERPQCYIGLTSPSIYDITFKSKKTLEFGPLLGEALKANEVDAVVWNNTAPQITAESFKILEDDKSLFPAQNVAPIVRTEVLDAYGAQLSDDINALSEQITTDDLIAWNTSTDIDKEESDAVATAWLEEKGLN